MDTKLDSLHSAGMDTKLDSSLQVWILAWTILLFADMDTSMD
jgi:hypothetical protein